MLLKDLKHIVKFNAKNLVGWKTKRKIVVISVDDYGNVRLNSAEAQKKLEAAGLETVSPFKSFDTLDSLETRDDLELLYGVLDSVKGRHGKPAVFTPFAVPCNIDFEEVIGSGFEQYHYELLPETYAKLSSVQPEAYDGAWKLWREGVERKLMVPQFHGREHLNLKIFKEKLQRKEHALITALKTRSFVRIPSDNYSTISTAAAFDFWDFSETEAFDEIIEDGLNAFEKVFGYRAVHFNPPGGREHPVIHRPLKENGIRYIDTPLLKKEHQGKGRYRRVFNYTGKQNELGQTLLVRNVVFEPTHNRRNDWVNYALKQIEAAFRWNRPAIISSHRVNFCGHIDPENRAKGLGALKELLQRIVQRWPEAEFLAANELGDLIASEQ